MTNYSLALNIMVALIDAGIIHISSEEGTSMNKIKIINIIENELNNNIINTQDIHDI